MAVVDTCQNLPQVLSDLVCNQSSVFLFKKAQKVVQVHFACLLDKVNVFVFHDDVMEFNNVCMLQICQDSNLSDSRRWNSIVLVLNFSLLYCYLTSILSVNSKENCTIRTLAKLPSYIVPLANIIS